MVDVAAGYEHGVALKSDGTVWTWGYNGSGQLGYGTRDGGLHRTPAQVGGFSGFVAISASGYSTLALQSEARGAAWGNNEFGTLGNTGGTSSVPTAVDALTGLAAVSAGGYHSVAVRSDGTVWTWGSNLYGEMGIGILLPGTSTPTQIMVGGPSVKAVATGEHHTLALTSTGVVYAWGLNANGQTGVGTVLSSGWVEDIPVSDVPVQVNGISVPMAAVAAGAYHSLALDSGGTVWAWGANDWRQLGNPPDPYTSRSVPAQVPGEGGVGHLSGVVAIAAGGLHSLALKSDGTVWAWGRNADGQLGNGEIDPAPMLDTAPVQVVDPSDPSGYLTGVAAIAAGTNFSLALKADGTVRAWGNDGIGQLGNGTAGPSLVPVPVLATDATHYLTGVAAIAAGYDHALARKSNGLLLAWGWNSFGQLGNGATTVEANPTPVHVLGPQAPAAISAGYRHSLALALTPTPDPAITGYITITGEIKTMTYGGTRPLLTYTSDTPVVLDTPPTCVSAGTGASNPGTYAIVCSGAAKTGYLIDYVPGTLIVIKAVLVVKANDMTVGSGSATPTLAASITGFVNGETTAVLSGAPSLSLAGSVITVGPGNLSAANYTFTFVPGTLTLTSDALQLFNNYFVTGDFVTGSVVLRGTGVNGKATGDITIPSTSIPATAEIVAAYLYWQTLENGTTTPGFLQGTFNEYGVNGEKLGGDLPYNDGTASGVMRFYRANVLGFLPLGTDGRRMAAGVAHHVSLPDSGSASVLPVTPGATLVVIYRVMSKTEPLRAVVIYDGAFSASAGNLYQTVRGFYDADNSSPSKLAYLWSHAGSWEGTAEARSVAAGAEQIALNESLSTSTALSAVVFSTPVRNGQNDGLLNAWKTNGGYSDAHDNSWVDLPGASPGQKDLFVQIDYMCSAVTGVLCTGHSHLPSLNALTMVADAFLAKGIHVHFDVGNNYQSPLPAFIVPAADAKGGNPIQEETCHDDFTVNPPQLCPFPEQPGVLAWKTNLGILKTWPKDLGACAINPQQGCTPRFQHGRKDSYHYVVFAHALGLPRWSFQDDGITSIVVAGNTATVETSKPHEVFPGAHVTISGSITQPGLNRTYLVSAVSVDGLSFTVQTENVTGSVNASSDSALFITVGELPTWSFKYRLHRIESGVVLLTNPHALLVGDQVTIANADTSGLNGTYQVTGVGPSTVAGKTYYTFTIPAALSADNTSDPKLSIISAQGGTVSGYADVGGADVAIALGKWLADGATDTTVAGTLMHELGHNLGLTHGGYFFDTPGVPKFEPNCKPNYQSVMSYLFQVDLLRDRNGNPVVGYSGQQLNLLNESALAAVTFLGSDQGGGTGFAFPEFANTSWYTSTAPAGNPTPASRRCSGTPLLPGETMYRVKGDADAISPPWANDQDINFDGSPTVSMRGYDDWDNLDLRQIGATGSEFFAAGFYAPGGGFYAPGGGFWAAGGGFYAPGGGFWAPGGGFYAPGGGFYAPGGGFYAPGGGFYAPGGGFYAPGGGFYAPGGGFWAPGGGFYAPGGGFYAPGGGFYAPGGGFYAPGGGFYAPGGGFYAPGGGSSAPAGFWAPGGGFYAPGGGFWAPGGGTALGGDLTYEAADSVVREPESVTVETAEAAVVVHWAAPIFGQAQTYYVYSTSGNVTQRVQCAEGDLPYTCTVVSPVAGATYSVSTVLLDGRESVPAAVPAEKRAQSIWLSPLPDLPYSNVPFVVTAVASSELSVAITASGGCTGTGANQASVTMNSVGTCAITAQQAGDGNFEAVQVSKGFTIGPSSFFTIAGFFEPVSMAAGVYNTVKGGSTVPLKFRVYRQGTLRTDTGVVKSFVVSPGNCSSFVAEDPVEFVTTGGTSLRYDSTLGGFIQNWKTPSTKGVCYHTSVTLIDGTILTAAFKTK
jgi:alpha-tubulin suppressor-like RCC1 family protein